MRNTRCEISKQAFAENFRAVTAHLPTEAEVLAVVKANAYGHGQRGVMPLLKQCGVKRFAVATVYEALKIREDGHHDEVLLLGGPYGEYELCLAQSLTPVFSDLDSLVEWGNFLRDRKTTAPCQLKFDTGMGRLGFLDVREVLDVLARYPQLKITGVMTHLSVADEAAAADKAFTELQLKRFNDVIDALSAVCPTPFVAHIANSALLLRKEAPVRCRALYRPGLALYGVPPQSWLDSEHKLHPVLSWKTEIHSIKTMPKGAAISYGRTFVTEHPSQIAVLPVGYADGYSRRFSGRAQVLIRGKRVPVVGRVCMDLTMVDVTDVPGVSRGDEVVLLGEQGGERLDVEQLAEWAETIPYEIFCAIGERVERIYV